MNISTATALVTGANRELGMHIARALRDRGATVFAGARDPGQVALPGVTPLRVDVTDPATIEAAFEFTGPMSILVNNAGSSTGASLLASDVELIRIEFDTHVFGSLAMTRRYAPAMAVGGTASTRGPGARSAACRGRCGERGDRSAVRDDSGHGAPLAVAVLV